MTGSQRKIVTKLAQERGLVIVDPDHLTVKRLRCGKGFRFVSGSDIAIRDEVEIARLKALAVPPAYVNVRLAPNPKAHLQAVGEDAAGRLQYRYHALWTEVREALKAQRLAGLAKSLPAIRRAIGRGLASENTDHQFAVAAMVELVRLTSIRAGGESYAHEHSTRGASTLLKSNIEIADGCVKLKFKAKGGMPVLKEVRERRFRAAMERLLVLPGRRLFQYCDEQDNVRLVRAADCNKFLRSVTGRHISLKDFRTLVASSEVLEALAATVPAASIRARKSQVRSAVTAAAEELTNTPTVCRTSYVHDSVVAAFEEGALASFGKRRRSAAASARTLARIVAKHPA
jgi:DNA topoisomerase I